MDKELQKAILAVMLKKDTQVDEAKKPLHPNQQKLDVHEPEKDELTAKDFEMLRAGKKAKPMKEEEELDEARFKKGEDIGKPGKNFAKIAKAAAARYGSEEAGKRVAGAVLKKVLAKEDVDYTDEEIEQVLENFDQLDEAGMPSSVARHKQNIANMSDKEFAQKYSHLDTKGLRSMAWSHMGTKRGGPGTPGHEHYVNKMAKGKAQLANEEVEFDNDADETILVHTPIEFELKESYNFGDYLTAAKSIVGEENAIELANEAFNNQDTNIFVEQFVRSDIEAKVKAHQKMGHKVSTPKYSTKSGQPHAEYVVTDKEGMRRKYIHHGSNRKMENMGPVGKRDEE